jgi:glycerophosphodiester phosphodiesterase
LELRDLAQVAPSELQDLGDCLREIIAFVSRLETFAQLNRDAIERLLAKRDRVISLKGSKSLETGGLLFASPWLNTAGRLRDLLDLSCRAKELHQTTVTTRSLLLQRVSPVALGCTGDEVHRCIRDDDSASLMVVLASPVSYMENQAMLYSVLQVAINYRATLCIKSLLEEITAPLEDSCGHQDALHQLVIQFSRLPTQVATADLLHEIIRELSPYQHHMLLVKDWRQRSPLHYAAEHGWAELCKQLVKFMEYHEVLEADASGLTPLHLAVSGGHFSVVSSFLALETIRCNISDETNGALLHLAVHTKFPDVLGCLLMIGKGLNWRDNQGRTALYSAADAGDIETVKVLLAVPVGIDIDLAEDSYGWSPLIVACARGHLDVVHLLLQAGAEVKARDRRGWSAVEHASYRAHMTIVDALQEAVPSFYLEAATMNVVIPASVRAPLSVQQPISAISSPHSSVGDALTTSIFVNLGSFDMASDGHILELEPRVMNEISTVIANQVLLEVSGTQCYERPYTAKVPLPCDISEATWLFTTTSTDDMKLQFKLFECVNDMQSPRRLLAVGIAALDHLRGWFRPGRQSLKRESKVALSTPEGDYAGHVTFTHLVCTPYKAPGPPRLAQKISLSDLTQVVGHRGLGWNMAGLGRMQIGEHTIQSLQSSLDQGADLIEFDVQITRDGVPVIYHDWQVSETGLDIPIHAMTYKQVRQDFSGSRLQ